MTDERAGRRTDTRKPRLSREELRALMLGGGREILKEEGIEATTNNLTFKRVFERVERDTGIQLTNASVIRRVWENQADFQADVLSAIAHDVERPEVDEAHSLVISFLDSFDLSTEASRLAAAGQLCRVVGASSTATMQASSNWPLWISVVAMANSSSPSDRRSRVRRALQEGYTTITEFWEESSTAFMTHLGLRFRPPWTMHRYTVVATALSEGYALREHIEGTIEPLLVPSGPDGELQEWTVFGLAMEALVLQCVEPDPAFTPPAALHPEPPGPRPRARDRTARVGPTLVPIVEPIRNGQPGTFPVRYVTIHGQRIAYRRGGDGPVVLLLHGIAGSSQTWIPAMELLADRYTVLAPDFVGHGHSDRPTGDYSLGSFANWMRDFLVALDIGPATVVGQSFGGGVAMQFAYQFPERCERLVLVDAGGLGREVNWALRLVTLPAAEYVLPVVFPSFVRGWGDSVARMAERVGFRSVPAVEVWRSYRSLTEREHRRAFVQTMRSVIDPGGQTVSAMDRLYLAERIPTLIVWGELDRIIPVAHAYEALRAAPHARLEVMPGLGHFPHSEDPVHFVGILEDFLDTSDPASSSPESVDEQRRRLLRGSVTDDPA